MFDFSALTEAWRQLKTMTPEQQAHAKTIYVWTVIGFSVYYIAAATVIIVLGRRLIQASFAAFKEARRERA
jgi:hypothetical protein